MLVISPNILAALPGINSNRSNADSFAREGTRVIACACDARLNVVEHPLKQQRLRHVIAASCLHSHLKPLERGLMTRIAPSKSIESVGTAIMVACAVIVTVLLVRREFLPTGPQPEKAKFVKGWETYAVGAERIGHENAPVTMVMFSDYECPYCRELASTLKALQDARPTDFNLVHRNLPLKALHPNARPAATAAACATVQGRFPQYHEYLFSRQDSLGAIDWTVAAHQTGVPDTSAFRRCLSDDPVVNASLRADSLAALRLGLSGTPALLINGWLVKGNRPQEELEELIAKGLKGKS